MPLADAPIRFADRALAEIPVSGRFHISQPARMFDAIRGAYDLTVREEGEEIVIARAPSGQALVLAQPARCNPIRKPAGCHSTDLETAL